VRYYHKMKLQKVYPLRVEWQPAPRSAGQQTPPTVVVQPVIPGALVAPARLTLDAAPDTEAVFYVTPLARGRMPEARVEATPPKGETVEIDLPMKSVTQRLTKWLLLLTFLVPALMLYFLKYEKLEGKVSVTKPAQAQKPQGEGGQAPQTVTIWVPGNPGEVLRDLLKDNLPNIPYVTEPVAEGLGKGYDFLVNMEKGHSYLPFYVGLALLVMTATSWFAHLGARGRRRSKPFPVAPPAPARPAPAPVESEEAPEEEPVEES
jgi:hypothetical protein